MSAQNTPTQEEAGNTADVQHDELTLLKGKADRIGLQYHPSIGKDALREKIKNHEAQLEAAAAAKAAGQTSVNVSVRQETAEDRAAAAREAKATRLRQQRREQMKLIRCRITNLNPAKRDLPGEVFTVANGVLGAVSKYVPYGEAGQSYHLPQIMVTSLRDRKFVQLRRTPGKYGIPTVEKKLVPEFSIEELTPLTKQELEDLAVVQAAGHNIG